MKRLVAILAVSTAVLATTNSQADNSAATTPAGAQSLAAGQPATPAQVSASDAIVTQSAAPAKAQAETTSATVAEKRPLPMGASFKVENTMAPDQNRGDENKISSTFYPSLKAKLNKASLSLTQPFSRDFLTSESAKAGDSRSAQSLGKRDVIRGLPYLEATYNLGEVAGLNITPFARWTFPIKSQGQAITGEADKLDNISGVGRIGATAAKDVRKWSLSTTALLDVAAVKSREFVKGGSTANFIRKGRLILNPVAQYNLTDKIAVGPGYELHMHLVKQRVLTAANGGNSDGMINTTSSRENKEAMEQGGLNVNSLQMKSVIYPVIASISPTANVSIDAYPTLEQVHNTKSPAAWSGEVDLAVRF